jgi:hypothetical protein
MSILLINFRHKTIIAVLLILAALLAALLVVALFSKVFIQPAAKFNKTQTEEQQRPTPRYMLQGEIQVINSDSVIIKAIVAESDVVFHNKTFQVNINQETKIKLSKSSEVVLIVDDSKKKKELQGVATGGENLYGYSGLSSLKEGDFVVILSGSDITGHESFLAQEIISKK